MACTEVFGLFLVEIAFPYRLCYIWRIQCKSFHHSLIETAAAETIVRKDKATTFSYIYNYYIIHKFREFNSIRNGCERNSLPGEQRFLEFTFSRRRKMESTDQKIRMREHYAERLCVIRDSLDAGFLHFICFSFCCCYSYTAHLLITALNFHISYWTALRVWMYARNSTVEFAHGNKLHWQNNKWTIRTFLHTRIFLLFSLVALSYFINSREWINKWPANGPNAAWGYLSIIQMERTLQIRWSNWREQMKMQWGKIYARVAGTNKIK